ncbi:MAG: DNA/RNA non-specific endonuclease [Cyanobacteriota bacterium]|nr:DNA/RNA non-specific endonuclease [Cyanobacteriota bacterium]
MANFGKQKVSSKQVPNLGQKKSIFSQRKFPESTQNATATSVTKDLSEYRKPQPGEMIANVMQSSSTSRSSSPPNYVTDNQLTAPKRQQREINFSPVHQLKAPPRQSNPSEPTTKPIQKQEDSIPNQTGLPDNLKAGVENLSGYSLDNVRVHYNSPKPPQLQALAYTQGTDIHVAPGQEKHLPHEAWHVVQQMQGRVKPTMQMKGFGVNDDRGLEHEADLMGTEALQVKPTFGAMSEISSPQGTAGKNLEKFPENLSGISSIENSAALITTGKVTQLFTAPPPNPPVAGIRGHSSNAHGVPNESHITTIHGNPNNLMGTVPGVVINGWPYIQGVGATGAWVRFHLINQQIGGLGNQNNLVPTSQTTNHDPDWRKFERTCQHHVGNQTSVHVTVDVQYHLPDPLAIPGTVQANQHFYPNHISAQCYLWDAVNNIYNLPLNSNPANQNTFSVNITPFPLLPPANAHKTNLRNQTNHWLRNTLTGGKNINFKEAGELHQAFQPTNEIDDYINQSGEPTPETRLLDALETYLTADLQRRGIPDESKINILNGSYHV